MMMEVGTPFQGRRSQAKYFQRMEKFNKTCFLRIAAAVLCLCAIGVEAQTIETNAWTTTGNGYWEDAYWSLGVLPGPDQAILLTNAGWKVLSIGTSTVQNDPHTLNVGSITVSSPPNSFNVLLVNNAGYQTPITANAITLNSNTVMTVLGSVLDVTNTSSGGYRLEVGGTVNQDEFSTVNASRLSLGNIGPGIYNLTNGTLNVVTGYMGGTFTGQLNQYGGDNWVSMLSITNLGEYDLYDGSLAGGVALDSGGVVKQLGGIFNGNLGFFGGVYELEGGLFTSTNMSIPSGEVIQTGGTNQISGPLGVEGIYFLSNGLLSAVGAGVKVGVLQQTGGIFTNQGDFVINYEPTFPDGAAAGGAVFLSAGWFATGSVEIYASHFIQSGGTNHVAGSITIEAYQFIGHSDYELSGGLLTASNLVILGFGVPGQLDQTGGSLFANSLSLNIPPDDTGLQTYEDSYDLSGGNLVVSNIQLSGYAVFRHQGGTLVHQGLLAFAGGEWDEQTTGQQFGMLQLANNDNTDSFLSLPTNACIIRFADSSEVPWSNAVNLILSNWTGSPKGGGLHQIIFGTNSDSLTAQQLSQIFFADVRGFPSGEYPARLLPTGELVPLLPAPAAISGLRRSSNGAVSLVVNGDVGKVYAIAVSTDLLDWSWWTNQMDQSGAMVFVDGTTPNFPKRFYRAFVQP